MTITLLFSIALSSLVRYLAIDISFMIMLIVINGDNQLEG
jgi:hypothetical protein